MAATIPTGAWSHVALVKNGNTIMLYINGILDTTAEVTTESAMGNFRLGTNKSHTGSNADWNGLIDDVYMANLPLHRYKFRIYLIKWHRKHYQKLMLM
ncbi:LamG-like jellyroll fold domain-containing protein [Paenibacillus oryzisoli]|uniref:LamG-like jellyroll fold domain-containing protein n=1 Tax=Paenibacillus oryzisoli TaxID=1850517 RepID=UPI003D2B5EC5